MSLKNQIRNLSGLNESTEAGDEEVSYNKIADTLEKAQKDAYELKKFFKLAKLAGGDHYKKIKERYNRITEVAIPQLEKWKTAKLSKDIGMNQSFKSKVKTAIRNIRNKLLTPDYIKQLEKAAKRKSQSEPYKIKESF